MSTIANKQPLRLAFLGYGAIVQDVLQRLRTSDLEIEVVGILRRNTTITLEEPMFTSISELIAEKPDLVIEAAGHQAVTNYAPTIIEAGIDLALVSVGALTNPNLNQQLWQLAKESGAKIYFPSAAIAGLDRLAAAAQGQLQSVCLTTKKPLAAWVGTFVEEKFDLQSLTAPTLIFEGTATEAAPLFPESMNVSVALGLATIGPEHVKVFVYVDPTLSQNEHVVAAKGDFGQVHYVIQNTPSTNPKTGVIVAMSLVKLLRNLTEPFVFGI